MSLEHFRYFVLPQLKKAVDAFKKRGAFLVKHTDGYCYPFLEDMVKTGIDALHSVDPTAGMDTELLKEEYGDRICLCGNIDCAHTLVRKSPSSVAEEVKRCINDASPGGGHILCSSNTIHSGVRVENYLTMVKEGRRRGVYPIV